MRHFVGLGIRGLLLEAGGLVMRVLGAWHYRRLLRRRERLVLHAATDAPPVN
jgi:hypothetical protein